MRVAEHVTDQAHVGSRGHVMDAEQVTDKEHVMVAEEVEQETRGVERTCECCRTRDRQGTRDGSRRGGA